MTEAQALELHPDRLFPADPGVRGIARRLYDEVKGLPLLSPHGHVDARLLLENAPFPDPATLLVTADHYVTRLLHAAGVGLDQLGVGSAPLGEGASRAVWAQLCAHWDVFRGTPVRYWLECELADIFGVTLRPSRKTADRIYDQVATRLADDEFLPRSLFERFNLEVLATTDDPVDDLSAHAGLAKDPSFHGRVIPNFRPDRYLEPLTEGWAGLVRQLGEETGVDTGDYHGYVTALEKRRQYFIAHGATACDHSHRDVRTDPLPTPVAERIYRAALAGEAGDAEATAFRRHMLLQMARMSTEDGLVMCLHPGVYRNHHAPTLRAYGPDTGHDIPLRIEFTQALRPLLAEYGTHPNLNLVLFTVDETTFSREIAPLAGFYPSVYAGAPWWYLDAPEAIQRFRSAVTETAGFSRTSGFIDDTRAFCSIPARHDMSRRLDCAYLAGLVAEHRLSEDEALRTAVEMVSVNPRTVFKL